jgi:uncharacterized membrane protein
MKRIFNYLFLGFFLCFVCMFIYLMSNLSETSNGQLLYVLGMSIVSFIFFIMTEKHASKETENRGFVTLLLVAICAIVIMFATSCSRYVSVDDAANGRARCGQSLR